MLILTLHPFSAKMPLALNLHFMNDSPSPYHILTLIYLYGTINKIERTINSTLSTKSIKFLYKNLNPRNYKIHSID